MGPSAASAVHGRGASSNGASGTRKIAPAEARSAFGPVGSAQPAERATPAPNASAVLSSVPTFPGSPTCHSASVSGRAPRGKSEWREKPVTPGGGGGNDKHATSAGAATSPT